MPTDVITADTITTRQIERLRDEATDAGDDAMVVLCDSALHGDDIMRRRGEIACAKAINAARAMRDAEAQDKIDGANW